MIILNQQINKYVLLVMQARTKRIIDSTRVLRTRAILSIGFSSFYFFTILFILNHKMSKLVTDYKININILGRSINATNVKKLVKPSCFQ